MSPEQVRGQDLDHRSDIFSFGLILYEMLAGQRAFQGESMAETMAAIAKEEPRDLSELNSKVTPQLEKIVRRCLEKKPERRFQTASDLGFALESLTTSSAGNSAGSASISLAKAGWRDRLWMIAAGIMGLALLAMTVAYFNRSATDRHASRLSFTPPENVTFDNQLDDNVVISPDGRCLAYVSDEPGNHEVYVQPFKPAGNETSGKWRISTNGGNQPRFRRDGRELFYVAADGQMMAVALKPSGATFEFETPKALFKTHMFTGSQVGIDYDVTADGQRFLIGMLVGEANATPVSVILNWTVGLKK